MRWFVHLANPWEFSIFYANTIAQKPQSCHCIFLKLTTSEKSPSEGIPSSTQKAAVQIAAMVCAGKMAQVNPKFSLLDHPMLLDKK